MMFQLIQCLVFLLSFCFYPTPTVSLPSRNSSAHLCHHDEKMALLQLKNGFAISDPSFFDQMSYPKTRSWKENIDCCFWDGIVCDSITGHVVVLDLSYSRLGGAIHHNSSLFHLRHLHTLNLAYNSFHGGIPPNMGLLSNLKVLNLSNARFEGQVPIEIARLSKLVLLDLSLPSLMDDMAYYGSNISDAFEYLELFVLMLSDASLKLEMPHFDRITKNLTSLRRLHLNQVQIHSVLPQTLSNLSSLTSLQLNFCNLQGTFPTDILKLPHLRSLMVNYNPNLYTDSSQFNILSSSLEVIDFSNTSFSGRLPEYLLGSRPSQLRRFSAFSCNLFGVIPSWVWNTTEEVELGGNHFIGELPSAINTKESLRFTHLGLSSNFLKGTIPSWLLTLPSLESLDLSGNNFSGKLDGSSFTGNSSLQFLDLSMNNLSIQLNNFSKFKNLSTLDLSNNALSLMEGVNSTASWPILSSLRLSSCNLSYFPEFLRSQKRVQELDLSKNRIQGEVPSWFVNVGRNSLMMLNISHNNIKGGFELLSWKNLMYIDISYNSLQGFLPVPPPYTSMFLASNNKFLGEISSSFCNTFALLGFLDLSYNRLSGKIPECLGEFLGPVLSLRSNRLHGEVSMNITESCNLESLDLNDNQFEGGLPQSLNRCKKLQVLDFGKNHFNGTFPNWLDTLPELKVLVLHSNKFQGSIRDNPKANKHPFPKLQILDLSANQFHGNLPVRYIEKFKAMMVDNGSGHNNSAHYIGSFNDYYHNTLVLTVKGLDVTYERILTILATLDFSNNRFSGKIPDSVAQLVALIGLNLSHNYFTSHIPPSLANLTSLESLDLSSNRLEGVIPPQLARLTFLEVFNVSENELVGQIPQGNQFNGFSNFSYGGNLGLCGYPLPECGKRGVLNHPPVTSLSQQEGTDFSDIITSISLWKIILIGFGIGTILGFFAGCCMLIAVRPAWFSRKVDRIEYLMMQSFKKFSRRWQRRN